MPHKESTVNQLRSIHRRNGGLFTLPLPLLRENDSRMQAFTWVVQRPCGDMLREGLDRVISGCISQGPTRNRICPCVSTGGLPSKVLAQ